MSSSDTTGAYQPGSPELDADDTAADLPLHIGRYRIERVLGKGGFGLVYLAHDDQLNRLVAIKVPHRHRVSAAEDAAAYLAEARTVANLDHPHIVPVYDVGSTEDCPCFIVSKLIEGSTLAQLIKNNRPTFAEAAELVASIAEALHYAHRRGLVHRDIKPANILLDQEGKAYVADFGIALREQDVGRGPRSSGTPSYMSPEQARGEGHRVDGRTDIFSLGVVLYELLTGRRPFKGNSRTELLEQAIAAEPRPPRQIVDGIPAPLERVCLKALSKRAAERYTTAQDLADDLRQSFAGTATTVPMMAREPISVDSQRSPDPGRVVVVPKGLRAYEADDADFFLDLLPGPRDPRGLPEAIKFWKSRIERTDPEETFSVGLLYGPSGCGKSSLVKAGLLPRLAPHVTPIYVEATPDLEAHLFHRLGRACPTVRGEPGLAQAMSALRRGLPGLPGGKLLIVIDQFEQWLHTHPSGGENELVRALRQCDGGRLQCLVMVRDDFWMTSTRFMQALEISTVEGHNSAAVDLFTPIHARRVLALFGRAYGTLPAGDQELTPAQSGFLDRAVEELAQDGWVSPVRLALFADMVKGRAWTEDLLRQLGGSIGIGVKFLDESFTAATAPPEHRLHQNAVRAVLSSLLPGAGTDMKGFVRSRGELLEASGYHTTPTGFDRMIKILVTETRLLTPVAADTLGSGLSDAVAPTTREGEYYQLTHDYLVPSIREWLARKQMETRRGRAELRLAERGAFWQAKPEPRQLPSLTEWLTIRLLTRQQTWTDPQRRMMRAATRRHFRSIARTVAVAALLGAALFFLGGRLQEEYAAIRADGLVRRLLAADVSEVPVVVKEFDGHRQWTDPQLEAVLADPTSRREHRLRAKLALLPVDHRHADDLREQLLDARPNEFPVIRDALTPHRDSLIGGLWEALEAKRVDPGQRFRAAAALAAYDPHSARWEGSRRWVAEYLAMQPSLVLPRWVDALRPVKDQLTPALAAYLRDHPGTQAASAAAEILGDYAASQPEVLADAIARASADAFAGLLLRLRACPQQGVPAVLMAFDQTALVNNPHPNEAASRRANLAIALLQMGEGERLWPLLKASNDPRVRSYLIDRLARLGCDPAVLLARLRAEHDDTIRAAILLAIGGYDPTALHMPLIPELQTICRDDGSAAVHAAAIWLLGKHGVRDHIVAGGPPPSGRPPDPRTGWYINSVGGTMVRIKGPVKFTMGSPAGEPGRRDTLEKQREVSIDYSYDIGMTEVTVAQFRQFVKQWPGWRADHANDAPAVKVTWYAATAYCNWLSKVEGLPPDQWCYEPVEDERHDHGMKIARDYRRRRGYRLPTEVEWEFACRGGAATSRCYGDAEELLPRYAWYALNAAEEPSPVATLLPNAFGLFDMHGNAAEWCQDKFEEVGPLQANEHGWEVVKSEDPRAARGGQITMSGRMIRSAKRFADRPPMNDGGGFRLARSRP
jgi:serine/threonine protein kinase/formylglycine-generating enzyme required for sulfatase activity